MSQLTIYKASAGSGKTYRLVLEYIKLLVDNPYNYRHILAVTFTNKATTEMKERILRDLNNVATDADQNFIKQLEEETQIPRFKIVRHAKLALANILHDYDRFAVSTIDSFFQRVLRSFARESGLYGTYEIDLDQDTMLEEACDRLLLSVEDDKELRNWLLTMSEDQLGEGKNWRINEKILELGKELYKESFQEYLLHQESAELERAKLKDLKSQLAKNKSLFEKEISRLGKAGLDLMAKHGLSVSDFKGGARSFTNYFNYWAEFRKDKLDGTKTLRDAVDDEEKWYVKKSDKKSEISTCFHDGLNEALKSVLTFIDENIATYNTTIELQKYIYALGVLTTLNTQIREIGKEKNSLLLSEGNLLLKGIIGNNDAPFIYEKAGSYYRFFMIDEFQDTSVTQWENLKPLVSNSLAENNPNLVVGDVKQSIYRWRNSDWQLLNKHLKQELSLYKIDETELEANWRSSESIVAFNNEFFNAGKEILQGVYNDEFTTELGYEEYKGTILNAYADVEQQIKSKQKGGLVQCELIPNPRFESEYEALTLEKVVDAVIQVQEQGYSAGDIAILVKKNSHGKKIAEALLSAKSLHEGKNLDVISDDSLYIHSSGAVRFLIGMMRYVLTPNDAIIQKSVLYEFSTNLLPVLNEVGKLPLRFEQKALFAMEEAPKSIGVFSSQIENEYFPFFKKMELKSAVQAWSYQSLIELSEELIKRYNLDCLPGDQANIQAFKDVVNDFSKRESGNLHKFIEWWSHFGEKVKLQSAGARDAINIMTIHKSKGLEFPIVILPFCDWNFAPEARQSNILWCSTHNSSYKQFPILPVKFSGNIKNSHFSHDYFTETLLSYIDNLNVLYVAQTRPVNGLFIFTEDVDLKRGKMNSVSALLNLTLKDKRLKLDFEEHGSTFCFGSLVKREEQKFSKSNEVNLSSSRGKTGNVGDSLRLKRNYTDFLNDDESQIVSQINQGKLFHEILSYIENRSDVADAVERLVLEGKIQGNERAEFISLLDKLLSKEEVATWFNGSYRILNETSILQPSTDVSRPDRVMLGESGVIVVDYKSTDKKSSAHNKQVKGYMALLQGMEYPNVEGYVWYLKSNELLKVEM